MNVLILAAGTSGASGRDGGYPLCLTELDGIPVIERLINACNSMAPKRFVFALAEEEVRRYHLDNVTQLLAPGSTMLRVSERTRGAACTALLSIDVLNTEDELLILNGDSLLDVDYALVVADFRSRSLDAGTVTFASVHPRYSYVRLNDEQLVVEAAEKNPISRHATAGFYWFARGGDFVRAAQNMIRKDAHVDGHFYICPAFNELVLEQRNVGIYAIESKQYHQLKTERQLDHYASVLDQGKQS